MTAAVYEFPLVAAPAPVGLHLTEAEVVQASGGYKRPADQLKVLHARGFSRAYIPTVGRRRVLLERDHFDAVVRGQFAAPDPARPAERTAATPNRGALRELFQNKRKK